MSESKMTTDHKIIRRWVEERNGKEQKTVRKADSLSLLTGTTVRNKYYK